MAESDIGKKQPENDAECDSDHDDIPPPPPVSTMSYTQLETIIKDLGQDPLLLDNDDLDKLVENKDLEKQDADKFKRLRNMKVKHGKIPSIPKLPEKQELRASEMSNFKSVTSPEVLPKLQKIDGDKGMGPLQFSGIESKKWLDICRDCSIFYGRHFATLGSENDAGRKMLFGKTMSDENLYGTAYFKPAQYSQQVYQRCERVENFSDKHIMSSIGIGGSYQSPFVSGSVDFSMNTENRMASKGLEVETVCKYNFPIGTIFMPKNYEELESSPFNLNSEFVKKLEDHIESELPREELLERLRSDYGDIVPRSIQIGVACYTTNVQTVQEEQSLEKIAFDFRAAINVNGVVHGGGIQANAGLAAGSEEGSRKQASNYKFESIAGNLADPNNPLSIAKYRLQSESWRVIHYGREYSTIVDYFPTRLKKKFLSYSARQLIKNKEIFCLRNSKTNQLIDFKEFGGDIYFSFEITESYDEEQIKKFLSKGLKGYLKNGGRYISLRDTKDMEMLCEYFPSLYNRSRIPERKPNIFKTAVEKPTPVQVNIVKANKITISFLDMYDCGAEGCALSNAEIGKDSAGRFYLHVE